MSPTTCKVEDKSENVYNRDVSSVFGLKLDAPFKATRSKSYLRTDLCRPLHHPCAGYPPYQLPSGQTSFLHVESTHNAPLISANLLLRLDMARSSSSADLALLEYKGTLHDPKDQKKHCRKWLLRPGSHTQNQQAAAIPNSHTKSVMHGSIIQLHRRSKILAKVQNHRRIAIIQGKPPQLANKDSTQLTDFAPSNHAR